MYGTYDHNIWLHEANQENAAGVDLALEVATGDTTFTWMIYWPCVVLKFGYLVTVAFDYDTQTVEGVVALDKRVTFGSETGRVEVCRIDLEDGLAIGGRFVRPPSTNYLCQPGDQLVVEVITQAAGGGSIAGDWVPFVLLAAHDEVPGNITAWSESVSGTDITQVV